MKEKLKNKTILYVEDDDELMQRVLTILEESFNLVFVAKNGLEALEIFEKNKIDIILSDINLPKLSGIEFIKKVREKDRTIPVIMLTAFDDYKILQQVIPLNISFYLVKPFFKDDLLNGFNSLFGNEVEKTNLKIDLKNQVVVKDGKFIELSKKEALLLYLLLEAKNRLVKYEEIQHRVYIGEDMSELSLRNLLLRLRKKLDMDIIKTVRDLGVILEDKTLYKQTLIDV